MRDVMTGYFAAEKGESMIFVAVGVLAIAASVWLWTTGSVYRGMAIPLVFVALIQVGVGGSILLRTDRQVEALTTQLAAEPARYKAEETARMEKVMAGFRTYKLVELAIFFAGVILTYAFARRDMIYAAGIGCITQASVMLVLDLFAEHRGTAYLDALRSLTA